MDITTDFGSVILGSSPGRCTKAKHKRLAIKASLLCFRKQTALLSVLCASRRPIFCSFQEQKKPRRVRNGMGPISQDSLRTFQACAEKVQWVDRICKIREYLDFYERSEIKSLVTRDHKCCTHKWKSGTSPGSLVTRDPVHLLLQ